MKYSMDISLAVVTSRTDPDNLGVMQCIISKLGPDPLPVYYTSPFATNADGGMIAVPEVGVKILTCSPYGSSRWFYFGSTFDLEPREAEGDAVLDGYIGPYERSNPDSAKYRGEPQQITLKNEQGAGLKISEQYNPSGFNVYTRLQGTSGKKVELNDNPQTDSVLIQSDNQARIKLAGSPEEPTTAPRSIEIESAGSQKFINIQDETDVVVLEGGRDINILNNANASGWGGPISTGNVNIQSKQKDVNIFTQAESGKIFIQCLNTEGESQHIQIETKGPDGTISIKTNGNLSIEAGGDINMNAGGEINMRSGDQMSLAAGADLQTRTPGTFTAEANFVRLAEPASIPGPPQSQAKESSFSPYGVTKY